VDDQYKVNDTLKVVLQKFPQLQKDIPIEKFIEFKNDPNTPIKLSRLKNWVMEISKSNYSSKEIEQKLERLLLEYSAHVEIHKLKYEHSVLETILTPSLEVLENLVTLKFSNVSKTLFQIGKQKIALLESEQKLPGSEVAFIHDIKNIKSL
jgi:hypothetical protein